MSGDLLPCGFRAPSGSPCSERPQAMPVISRLARQAAHRRLRAADRPADSRTVRPTAHPAGPRYRCPADGSPGRLAV